LTSTFTDVDTLEPFVGERILIAGGVVSEELSTVTETAALAVLPAASLPVAVILCDPFVADVVFHVKFHGATVSVPSDAPSTSRLTEVTPTLSVAAT